MPKCCDTIMEFKNHLKGVMKSIKVTEILKFRMKISSVQKNWMAWSIAKVNKTSGVASLVNGRR